ncbi:ABC transporter ATP-binding protein [Aedoeadaptatus acetigenes]|uniref:ABC transporter ATP-binding protein n=1 Tax=Aedoeadaptatus acetigenes TaxID=2981723 RepID=A0ABV1J3V8_9FIRM|nr:ABC transporter ATP-binding protein [Aedoeadaptatus acetigenes]MBS6524509.1 ABC transporter ATP-binding protein [Peptoniphilaceae bacterium]MCU6785766.1 ABC transporter ATP-binding protein [Aedoeadaptatus acetigenes]
MIKFENVSFSYNQDSRNIIENINLEIKKGEVVAFIGASGCGKTTLTRIINGLAYKFYGGKLNGNITIDGINPCEKELYEIGRRVGSIFQNPKSQFFTENVEDEIAFGLENYGVDREKISRRIREALSSINGENLIDKSLFHLSSGERQKIAIASINALDPPIYVFDEPSANLDMKSVEALRKLMLSLKTQGKTMVISEHRIYYLKDLVDKYYYLENGEIRNSFSEKELLSCCNLSCCNDFFRTAGLRSYSLECVVPKTKKIKEVNSMELDKICFSYKNEKIISELSYSFKSGNVYGIMGDNGVGKSTLFKILSGLLKEQKGNLLINGEKIKKTKRKRRIYYLSNNPDSNLFEVSLEDELKLNDSKADIDFILHQFHLETVKDLHPQILSGGQKQRLTIAAAELLKRDVFLFDEPTSGLDGNNMRIISERMKELQEKQKIILIISHDYEFLMTSCNKVLYLDGQSFKEFSAENDKEKILEILKGEVKNYD